MTLSIEQLEESYQGTRSLSLDELESAYQETLPKPGVLKSFGKGVAAGTLGVAESVGTALQYAGERLGSEKIAQVGKETSDYWEERASGFRPNENIAGKNLVDNPELLKNPAWWAYNIGDMLPSLGVSILPGLGAQRYIQMGATALKWTPTVVTRLAQLGGMVFGGAAGGTLEAANTYKTVLENKGSEEEAARAAEAMFAITGTLNALSVGKILGKAGTTLRGKVIKHSGAAAWEGITEGLEEPGEVFAKLIGKYLSGAELPESIRNDLIESFKAGLTIAPIAAVTGGGASVLAGGEAQPEIPQQTIEQLEAQRQTVLSNIQEQYAAGALTTEGLISIKKDIKKDPRTQSLNIDAELDELIIESKSLEPMVAKEEDIDMELYPQLPEPPKQISPPPEKLLPAPPTDIGPEGPGQFKPSRDVKRPTPGGEAIELEASIEPKPIEYDYQGFKNAIGIQDDVSAKPLWKDFQKTVKETEDKSEAFEIWNRERTISPAATGKAGLKRADIEIAKAKTLKDETGEGVAGESIAKELGIQYNGYWKDIDKQLWTDTTKGKESSFASKTLEIAEVKEQLAKTRKGYEDAAKPKKVEPRGAEEAVKVYRQGRAEGKWWTPNREYAESFGKKDELGKKGEIQEKKLPSDIKLIDEVELKKSMTESELAKESFDGALDRLGYDGLIRLEEDMSGNQYTSYYMPEKKPTLKPTKAKPEGKGETKTLIDKLKDQSGSIEIGSGEYKELTTIAQSIYSQGHTKFSDFTKQMKKIFSDVWDKIKRAMLKLFSDAKRYVKDQSGVITIREGEEKPVVKARKEFEKSKGEVQADQKEIAGLLKERSKPFNAKAFLEAIPEYNQFKEAMSDPSTKRVIDEAFDNMSYFKQRFGKSFKKTDMKLMKRIFTLPYWAGKDFKHIGKAVQVEIDLGEERSSIVFKDYNDTRLGEIQTSLPKNKVAFKQYNGLTWKWDNKRFSKKDVPANWYKDIKKGEDIEINPEHYAQVEAYLTKQGYEAEAIEAFVEVRKLLDAKYVDLDKLMRIEKANPTLIEEFRAEFGKINNYFPHRRTGDAYVQVIDSKGKVAYRAHYWEKSDRLFKSVDKKARSVAKQWAENKGLTGYKIKEGAVTSLPDDVYFKIPVEAMQQIASQAGRQLEEYRAEYEADRLVKKEGYTKEEALKLARKRLTADMEEALSKAMSDVFKVRGWGRHGIRRKNIPGQETEDTFGILYDYLNGYAGFKTKIKRAKAHSANLMDLNAKKNPQEYEYLARYVKDVLSNSDKIDRWVDGARALFFVKYLGFVPKSGMVNLTQNIILAAPLLSQYTKGSTFKLSKAMVDVRKSLISKNALMGKEVKYGGLPQVEQDALHDMIEGGTTMDLFLREVKGNIPGTGWGKYANKFIDKSGIFMMLAEKFNRASTGLAAFRIAYNEGATLKDGTSTKGDYEKAIRWAKKRVYDAHFLYGKANYPELMRGSATGKIMRAGYTFRTFTHNYLLCMSNLLMKQGPAGKKAFARSLRNLFLMGGLTAIPFFKAMSQMLTWVLGDDDKDPLTVARGIMPYDWMKDMVTFGLPGVMGFDLTGSLSIEAPRNWKDIIGVPYAALDDSINMVKSLQSGQIYRAISETPITPIMARNAMRGLELYTEGQVSRSGKAINYLDQMGPKKITTKEMVGKSLLGLQPTSVSKGYKAYQATSKMKTAIQRKQSNWASQYVNALRANDRAKRDKILEEINAWNKKAVKEGATHKIINIKDAVKARLQPGYKTIPKKMRKEALRISEQWR